MDDASSAAPPESEPTPQAPPAAPEEPTLGTKLTCVGCLVVVVGLIGWGISWMLSPSEVELAHAQFESGEQAAALETYIRLWNEDPQVRRDPDVISRLADHAAAAGDSAQVRAYLREGLDRCYTNEKVGCKHPLAATILADERIYDQLHHNAFVQQVNDDMAEAGQPRTCVAGTSLRAADKEALYYLMEVDALGDATATLCIAADEIDSESYVHELVIMLEEDGEIIVRALPHAVLPEVAAALTGEGTAKASVVTSRMLDDVEYADLPAPVRAWVDGAYRD